MNINGAHSPLFPIGGCPIFLRGGVGYGVLSNRGGACRIMVIMSTVSVSCLFIGIYKLSLHDYKLFPLEKCTKSGQSFFQVCMMTQKEMYIIKRKGDTCLW